MSTSVREKTPEQLYEDQVRIAETKMRGIIKDRPGSLRGEGFARELANFADDDLPPDRSVTATLCTLRGGKEIRQARARIEYLLEEEAPCSGLHQPEYYGPHIAACATEVKELLEGADSKPGIQEHIEAVIQLVEEVIADLREAEPENITGPGIDGFLSTSSPFVNMAREGRLRIPT